VVRQILDFYSGAAPDDRGRFLVDIQAWDDDRLEAVHNYIQWLFPLLEPSPVNPSAPVLTRDIIAEFRARPELQANLRASFLRMLRFYGLEWSAAAVGRAANFAERSREWLLPGNHNHLRITRILKCLALLGVEAEARAFFTCLTEIYQEERGKITAETYRFWSAAVGPGLTLDTK
jgi:hypothetical protein